MPICTTVLETSSGGWPQRATLHAGGEFGDTLLLGTIEGIHLLNALGYIIGQQPARQMM